MKIYIIAVGDKSPSWIEQGISEYVSRMPHECCVNIITVATTKRAKNISILQAQEREQDLLLKASPKDSFRVALDGKGNAWSTLGLADKLQSWMQHSPNVIFYIGGPDGFTQDFLEKVDLVWSLSLLTMPHMLVRLLLVEQIYRAWTVIQGHPYHRQ